MKTVLLVDDDDAFRDTAAQALRGQGYRVDAFDSGSKAFAALLSGESSPDVMLVDLILKDDMDGWQLLDAARVLPACSRVPLVAITGADIPHLVRRTPADAFLFKPFALPALYDCVREWSDRQVASGRDRWAPKPALKGLEKAS